MKTRRILGIALLLLGLMNFGVVGLAASKQLLSNPGFEVQKEGELPPGWQKFGLGELGQELCFEQGSAYDGEWEFIIRDEWQR